jgi:hypothetical protein
MKLNFFDKIKQNFKNKFIRAFSLNDLSVVMSTIAVVAVSAVAISNIELNGQKEKADSEKVGEIYKSIGKFLLQKKRLPCPAGINKIRGQDLSYGVESISAGDCVLGNGVYAFSSNANLLYGTIPAQTLGLSSDFVQDQYGSKIVYIVDKRATYSSDSVNENIGSMQNPSIVVRENNVQISSGSIMLIITHGKNKFGAFNYNSTNSNALSTSLNENENSFSSIISASNQVSMDNVFIKNAKDDGVFDDDILFKDRDSLINDFYADFLIPCKNAGPKYGNQNAVFGQIIYATSACSFPNQNIVPAKKCGRDGKWIYEKSCPCYVNSEGVNPLYVPNGSGSVKCEKPGFDGVLEYTCDEESNTKISLNCKRTCQFSRVGLSSIAVKNGTNVVSCNQENYKGEYVVTCDNGVAVSAIGSCYDSRCLVGGHSGMRSKTINSDESGIFGQCEDGYSGSYSFSCYNGVSNVTNLCRKDCSFSTVGISSRVLKHGNYEFKCDSGYSGDKVEVICQDGVANIKSGGCFISGNCSVGTRDGMIAKTIPFNTASRSDGECKPGYSGSYSYSCSASGVATTTGSCVSSTCEVGKGDGMKPKTVSSGTSGEDGECSQGFGGYFKWSCSGGEVVIENYCVKSCRVGLVSQGGEGMQEKLVGFDKEGDQGACDISKGYVGTFSWSCKINPTTRKVEALVKSNNCKNYCAVGTPSQGSGMVQKNVAIKSSGTDGQCDLSKGHIGSYSWSCDENGYSSVSANKCVNYCLVGTPSQGVGMFQKQVTLGSSGSDGVCNASTGYFGSYSWSCSAQGIASITQNNCALKTCAVIGGSDGMNQKSSIIAGKSGTDGTCGVGYRGSYSWNCSLKGVASTVNNCVKLKCQVPSSSYPNLFSDLVNYTTSSQTLACKAGYSGGSLSYTCADAGGDFGVLTVNSYSPCTPVTCAINSAVGFVDGTVVPYSTTPQNYYCNDPIYNNFSTALFPACDSPKTLTATSNSCDKISCAIPAVNASNVFSTSIFIGDNQNLTCASGYYSSSQVTASCSVVNATRPVDGLSVPQSGNYTIAGSCTPVTCTINSTAGFVDGTIVPYSTIPQNYYCNDPIYNNFSTATFPSCDSPKTLTAVINSCDKISCAIPAVNASNVLSTSIFIGDNQNLTCASGYASSSQVTASCSAVNATRPADGLSVPQSGNYTIAGVCALQISCPISLAGISNTSINYGSNNLTCSNGFYGTLSYSCDKSVCNDYVTVYSDTNYGGSTANHLPGTYDFPLAIGNDTMSSAKIPNGLQVTLYQDGLGSSSKVLTSDVPNFSLLTFGSGANLDNNTSAFIVTKLANCQEQYVATSNGAQSSCSPIQCTVPTTANTVSDGQLVNYATASTPLSCKAGYIGSPTYTCTGSTNPGTYAQAGTPCTIDPNLFVPNWNSGLVSVGCGSYISQSSANMVEIVGAQGCGGQWTYYLPMVPSWVNKISFDWYYWTGDSGSYWDKGAVYINNQWIYLAQSYGQKSASGTITNFAVGGGTYFGPGIYTMDGCCGRGYIKLYNVKFN